MLIDVYNLMELCAKHGTMLNLAGPMASDIDGKRVKTIQVTVFKKSGDNIWDQSVCIASDELDGMSKHKKNAMMFNCVRDLIAKVNEDIANQYVIGATSNVEMDKWSAMS